MHRQPQPATVFLVDDDPSVLRAVGRLVRSAGWNAATFNSAREFLEKQDPDAPGCLVLDVTMPGFDGLDLQQALAHSRHLVIQLAQTKVLGCSSIGLKSNIGLDKGVHFT